MREYAELISLAWTIPTLIMAGAVILYWKKKATQYIIKNDRTPEEWLMIGIWLGFIGAFLDNAYWGLPWTLSYMESESTDTFMKLGVYFNIFSRQALGSISAYCHLKAFKLTSEQAGKDKTKIPAIIYCSILGGLIVAFLLLVIKYQG